jgi:DNA-damage-inducible protein J
MSKTSAAKKLTTQTSLKKNAMIRARAPQKLKEQAENILEELGLSPTDAINLFYKQVCLRNGLPFAVLIPNQLTDQILKKSARGEDVVEADNTDDLFNKLGI